MIFWKPMICNLGLESLKRFVLADFMWDSIFVNSVSPGMLVSPARFVARGLVGRYKKAIAHIPSC